MNLTEQYRPRTLSFIMPPSEGPISGWRGYALRVSVLAVGYGIYVLLFRKKDSSGGRWSLRRTLDANPPIEPDGNSEVEISEPRYNYSLNEIYHFCSSVCRKFFLKRTTIK